MRATLHDRAPNTYYGQWPGEKPPFAGLESPAIAHNGLAASARFVAFDVPERDFPGNRSPPRWKFVCRPKRKSARLAKWRVQRRPRRSPFPSKATALLALGQVALDQGRHLIGVGLGDIVAAALHDMQPRIGQALQQMPAHRHRADRIDVAP